MRGTAEPVASLRLTRHEVTVFRLPKCRRKTPPALSRCVTVTRHAIARAPMRPEMPHGPDDLRIRQGVPRGRVLRPSVDFPHFRRPAHRSAFTEARARRTRHVRWHWRHVTCSTVAATRPARAGHPHAVRVTSATDGNPGRPGSSDAGAPSPCRTARLIPHAPTGARRARPGVLASSCASTGHRLPPQPSATPARMRARTGGRPSRGPCAHRAWRIGPHPGGANAP